MKEYYLRNKTKYSEKSKKKSHSEYHKSWMKDYHRLKTYGISKDQFNSLLQDQDSKCSICKKFLSDPVIDHCHSTGRVRSLLCRKCNAALGLFEESVNSLENAIQYLKSIVNS